MKKAKIQKVMIQLIIISVVIASYTLPVLARGGGGP